MPGTWKKRESAKAVLPRLAYEPPRGWPESLAELKGFRIFTAAFTTDRKRLDALLEPLGLHADRWPGLEKNTRSGPSDRKPLGRVRVSGSRRGRDVTISYDHDRTQPTWTTELTNPPVTIVRQAYLPEPGLDLLSMGGYDWQALEEAESRTEIASA
jgi:hypothetical protein